MPHKLLYLLLEQLEPVTTESMAPVKMPEMPIAVVHALSLQTTVPDLALQPNWVALHVSHPQAGWSPQP